ncbi:hypothetical protein U0C82_17405 [Fulvimarina sp. 2208YS6-2-32]|uniref:Helix-turn-helix domain-containing protein n=1 Tax=Fulvimarina uroteuthidis TaxID=3098149 RepID=A0ABU5I7W8_9HYPH|nr:hypothetical protein [Fulvimarina sp. 2208YS6-2-32]MDY8110918.1 hypothetical protein [Fulvimarina sp. 2208YS6-2-32]
MAHHPKLTRNQRLAIAKAFRQGTSAQALSERYRVTKRTIYYAAKGEEDAKIASGARTQIVNVRMTKNEVDAFDRVLERHRIERRGEGLRSLIHAANGLFVTDQDLKDRLHGMRVALNRVGNNVSQIAKRMHEANLRAQQPAFADGDLAEIRELAGMVTDYGDQLARMIERQQSHVELRLNAALTALRDGDGDGLDQGSDGKAVAKGVSQ